LREVRDNPSPSTIQILDLKGALAKESSVAWIRAAERAQPLTEYVMKRIEKLNTRLTELEKRITEIRRVALGLQEQSQSFVPQDRRQNRHN